jgi:tryptophan synthase alpha chain
MSRYATMFGDLARRDEIAFGAFLMLGDPDRERCLNAVDELVAAGVDFLELGIPFSDPVADGPVIQAAAARALVAGVTTSDAIALLAAIRTRHPSVPVGVLTYANIVMARGREEFARSLAEAGVDSLLIADVPALEAAPFAAATEAEGIAPVLIAAANTPDDTLGRIARLGQGYTYVVARKGITGANDASDTSDAGALITRLQALQAPPSILGFGISRPEQVAAAAEAGAAGVISGSAIVDLLASGKPLAPFVRQMKEASRRARQNA